MSPSRQTLLKADFMGMIEVDDVCVITALKNRDAEPTYMVSWKGSAG